jgi:hypothetical protein
MTSVTQQVTLRDARNSAAALEHWPATARLVESLQRRLRSARELRRRGKPYDHLVVAYFADMARVLPNTLRVLAPRGRAAWVIGDSAPYGVHIDTPALVGILAEEVGFRVIEDRPLRSRGSRWKTAPGRQALPLSERMLVFEKPSFGDQQALF